MKTVELRPPDIHGQKTVRLVHPSESINPICGDCEPLPGGRSRRVSSAPA